MEKADNILQLKNIKKSFKNLNVLSNINFNIKSGELVILLGPNGAGKSTLFSIISGLILADKGTCEINNFDIKENPVQALKSLGIVFQQPTIDMDLSIEENLLFHSRLQGLNLKVVRDKIKNVLKVYNLSQKLYSKVRILSGGERRKVELIRSLLHSPKMILMDEPTVGLDPNSRISLLENILELKLKNKLSILWATHLVDEAEKADKVIILNNGSIVEMGEPKKIIAKTGENNLERSFFKLIRNHKNE